MTLATHIVVGTAVAGFVPNHPFLGFSLAFLSHFVLDAIPHWDYKLEYFLIDKQKESEIKNNKIRAFFIDSIKIGTDIFIGVFLSFLFFYFFFSHFFVILFSGFLGGVIPDALQFVYSKFKHQPLVLLQKFHIFVHGKYSLKEPFIGVLSQIVIAFVSLFILLFFSV